MQVKTGVSTFDLECPLYGEERLSVHIIQTEDATVLFGGGFEHTASELVEIAQKRCVDVVIVEHGHEDHYGGVPILQEAFDPDVAVSAGDASTLEEKGIVPDHKLGADEYYWGVKTIGVPGHTPDNMAFLHENVLIAGDTVVGSDSIFAADDDWRGSFAVVNPEFSTDDEQARNSIRHPLDYDFEIVLTSHGSNVLENGYEEVETLADDLK